MKEATGQTPATFRYFLSWLDEGVESHGEKYLEVRRRLVWYFQRKRCLSPQDLADESLNRVARRLEEEGTITDTPPVRYCYIVAKFVFLEYLRKPERAAANAAELKRTFYSNPGIDDRSLMLDCLDRCLGEMDTSDRELILEYYRGDQKARGEQRRMLAVRMKLSSNALTIRACRIRAKLEGCVTACSAGPERSDGHSAHQE